MEICTDRVRNRAQTPNNRGLSRCWRLVLEHVQLVHMGLYTYELAAVVVAALGCQLGVVGT